MLCFGLGEEREETFSLWSTSRRLKTEKSSVQFPFYSSTLHIPLPSNRHFSSLFFQRHSLVRHKMTLSSVWVFESMSYDHLSSLIHTQSYWFSWFCTFTAEGRCCFEQFAVCPFCGVIWLLSLPSQPKEERAGHKKLLGLWENLCLPNSLK